MDDAAKRASIFVTATGCCKILEPKHFMDMRDNSICCNIGHFDCEVDVAWLEENCKKDTIKPQVPVLPFMFLTDNWTSSWQSTIMYEFKDFLSSTHLYQTSVHIYIHNQHPTSKVPPYHTTLVLALFREKHVISYLLSNAFILPWNSQLVEPALAWKSAFMYMYIPKAWMKWWKRSGMRFYCKLAEFQQAYQRQVTL